MKLKYTFIIFLRQNCRSNFQHLRSEIQIWTTVYREKVNFNLLSLIHESIDLQNFLGFIFMTFFGLPTTVSRASPRLICWSTRVAHLAWWVSLPTGIFCIHKRSNPRAPQTCLSDTKLLTTWTNPRWFMTLINT